MWNNSACRPVFDKQKVKKTNAKQEQKKKKKREKRYIFWISMLIKWQWYNTSIQNKKNKTTYFVEQLVFHLSIVLKQKIVAIWIYKFKVCKNHPFIIYKSIICTI